MRLILLMFLCSSVGAFEFGFDASCTEHFRKLVRAQVSGNEVKIKDRWHTTAFVFSETWGGNVGSEVTPIATSDVAEIDRAGFAVMWRTKTALAYNRASRATDAEIVKDLRILLKTVALGGKKL